MVVIFRVRREGGERKLLFDRYNDRFPVGDLTQALRDLRQNLKAEFPEIFGE